MTMPVRQADMAQPRTTEAARPLGKPDREAADRFREALDRTGGRPGRSKQDGKDGAETPPPLPLSADLPPPVIGHPGQAKHQTRDERADMAMASTTQASPPPRDAAAVSPQPLATPAADVIGFSALVARLDSGLPPSALSHLALPGDLWRADQVMIDQQAGGLSVTIDMGGQGDANHESLNELAARLRARGMNATVSQGEPSRIAEVDSRIA